MRAIITLFVTSLLLCSCEDTRGQSPKYVDSPINKEEYFYIESITYEYFAIVQNNSIYHIDIVFNI